MSFPQALAVILVFLTGAATGWISAHWLINWTLMSRMPAAASARHEHLARLFHRHPFDYADIVWSHAPPESTEDLDALRRVRSAFARHVVHELIDPNDPPPPILGSV